MLIPFVWKSDINTKFVAWDLLEFLGIQAKKKSHSSKRAYAAKWFSGLLFCPRRLVSWRAAQTDICPLVVLRAT